MGVHAQYGNVVSDTSRADHVASRHVAIVGAGPAGLMAADIIATAGHRVTVYDRMAAPARKFLLAGRGGLNLTHSEPLESFLTRYRSGAGDDIVRRAIQQFPPERLVAWANALGQDTFVGSSGRVFPKTMKASPLLRAWLQHLDGLGVVLKARHEWRGFGEKGSLTFNDANHAPLTVKPDATIFALGGASWPRLGSDGMWVAPMQSAGVHITPLMASNCGVTVAWSDVFKSRFAGAPLKRIAVTVDGVTQRGAAVITAQGLEGGVIYALGPAFRMGLQNHDRMTIAIDLKPDVEGADLEQRIARPRGSQSLSNHLRKVANLDAPSIALMREVPLPVDAGELARLIKSVPLHVTGLAGLERAISTAGGISAKAIDESCMMKAYPGIFVAGEMLDWDAPTGGYLLQGCFATAALAAEGALRWLRLGA
ncbi:MAG: aminoacetone oxidase family FAD-binding enzyme [Hyphomicrobium sp.]|nr:MAG: aminoacetone oxidase family FAD-binding enzyme [Hyphomicrobium sp.]PPC99882.1 MAG: aminoacetone oxidase family FAD-binding enzyme [Hyphomicrobium sp.]